MEMKRKKLVAGEEVLLEEKVNELGGVEEEYGTEYFTEEGEFVGVLGHSVGPYGISTGVFAEVKSTCPLAEAEEILAEE